MADYKAKIFLGQEIPEGESFIFQQITVVNLLDFMFFIMQQGEWLAKGLN